MDYIQGGRDNDLLLSNDGNDEIRASKGIGTNVKLYGSYVSGERLIGTVTATGQDGGA